MPRKLSGTVKYDPAKGCYRARITLIDGFRPWVDLDPGPKSPTAKKSAQGKAAGLTERAREKKLTRADFPGLAKLSKLGEPFPLTNGETSDEWFKRYTSYQRIECGQTDPTKATRWSKWISPRIGGKAISAVTRDDIEDLRDTLDAAVRAWTTQGKGGDRISGKTAMNVWSALTSAFKAARSSKRRDLRVLVGKPNPCTDVEPPGDKDSRKSRRKTFLYPKECAAIVACEAIPFEWREIHAIAAYTYLRPGELRVLAWSDVDLTAGLIHVTKAWDYNDEEIKAPKTRNGVRRIPIEPTLAPLLTRMREGKADDALVVPGLSAFGEDHLAELFRSHLMLAGVKRIELHRSTKTHVQSNFRSWRDSGITWLAMQGVDTKIMVRRAGHDTVDTTMGYVKLAEDLTGDLGTPFGPLPTSLLGDDEATSAPDEGGPLVPESSASPESEPLPSIPPHVAATAMARIARQRAGSDAPSTGSNPFSRSRIAGKCGGTGPTRRFGKRLSVQERRRQRAEGRAESAAEILGELHVAHARLHVVVAGAPDDLRDVQA